MPDRKASAVPESGRARRRRAWQPGQATIRTAPTYAFQKTGWTWTGWP